MFTLFRKVRGADKSPEKDGGAGRLAAALGGLGARFGPREFVLVLCVLYMLVFSALTIERHEVYSSARFDLGNMDQAVWNTTEGRILEVTGDNGENRSRLINHTDFFLLAYVPLYMIYASPYWLLVSQAVIVGLGALPLYWLSARFLGRGWPAALIAGAYLFSPGLQSANTFDFHSQTLAPTFLLFAFHYLLERRLLPFVVFAALASFCKEEISLLVAMMGLYVVFVERRPRWGVPVFLAGVGYFAFVMGVLIPAFNEGTPSGLVEERYGAVGGSVGGVLATALTDPLSIVQHALSGQRPVYLLSLLGMGGMLGLLSPGILMIALPEVAVNLLSERRQMISIFYHYSAPIWPFVYLASAAGIANVVRFVGWLSRRRGRSGERSGDLARALPLFLASWVFVFGVYLDLIYGPIPIAQFYEENPVVMRSLEDDFVRNVDEAVALVPDDPEVRVSASNWIAPHLAHRETLYLFPVTDGPQGPADYVVVDLARASYYTDVRRPRAQAALERVQNDPRYSLIFAEPNVAVFRLDEASG
ncbi:putative membrane protein (DUF2079) [Rubrobacter radiotolerans]|uniref:DUF2079 domain-containing protein n=1 Tax=Rubrobacter radiotolerans TaxID=42256 RepID=A0A023WZT0_RUBRA|nr:DUF2079 domain-containing protein [Rubrobacter radiotolerans]AHY45461.1 putative membrane protein (DUF2079) [Rubrobacter radiotolerans]MDX5892872.1 DUF2079 domain-containing protein [Rubrobacter radiotolerans]SMC02660.1 Uncharacterized membrane protein [Rubrobacter radiotolerans DSM 5868]